MSQRVVIVGGGIGGVAAATLLAEQGVDVTLLERDARLGGRAGGWTDLLRDGTLVEMERGTLRLGRFDRNVRSLVGRVDPSLSSLAPLDVYPLLGPEAEVPSLARLGVMDLLRRASQLRLRDIVKTDLRRASLLLSFDPDETYRRLDGTTAKAFLETLRLPAAAVAVVSGLVGHSAYDTLERYSAAELVSLFHYHLGDGSTGLELDILRGPATTHLWEPLARHLASQGATVSTRAEVLSIERGADITVRYRTRGLLRSVKAAALVVATDVPGLQKIAAASPDLASVSPWIHALGVTLPMAVWRLWLDRPVRPERAPFAVTVGLGMLDAISVHERFAVPGSRWERERGRSVIELHAYAVPDSAGDGAIRANLLAQLHATYAETRAAKILDERFVKRRDCPAFLPGSQERRPGVTTADPRVFLAGDFVRIPFPSSPLERAAASGFLAANTILAGWGKPTEPIAHWRVRGALARLRRASNGR